MSDNPFKESSDDDRTVLRVPARRDSAAAPAPSAGGRPPPAPPAGPPSGPPGRPPGGSSSGPGATPPMPGGPDAVPKVGRTPLLALAAPLLDLLARIGARASPRENAGELNARAMKAMQNFELEGRAARIPEEQLRAAHYALCAALDDAALNAPWGHNSPWAARSLASVFHQDVRSGERFFDLLASMQKEPGRYGDVLELFYWCLSLGFRGRYRLDSRGAGEIERVREGLHQLLSNTLGRHERELSPHWHGVDAPHLGPQRQIPTWAWVAMAFSLLALGWLALMLWTSTRGDAWQQRLVKLPPAGPTLIERSVPPVAPATAGSSSSDVVKRFQQFLAEEIRQGLVAVEGDAQRLVIRVMSRGMFDSGSAEVSPRFVTLLQRIGQALATEPGRVLVLGHSDNQPIRSVRFPSNFELSAARADAARRLLAASAGQSERFAFEGRADTEPLTSNDSVEGRETNRRIDIVMSRQGSTR